MKYNKLIVGGCSFVAQVHDAEDINRNVIPDYIKEIKTKLKSKDDIRKYTNKKFKVNKNENRWSTLVSNKLSIELVDFSVGGNSNERFFRDIFNYLINNPNEKNNLVIIGLTASNRISRFISSYNKNINIHLKDISKIEDISKLYSYKYFFENDLVDFQNLYIKYFYDYENEFRLIKERINLLKYICNHQNNKLIIFDNLFFRLNDKKYLKEFIDIYDENLFYFEEKEIQWPEWIKTYDSKYKETHPHSVDHKILAEMIIKKIHEDK